MILDKNGINLPETGAAYILRHGHLENNGLKRYIGWTNAPLSETGNKQAVAWRRILEKIPFDRIYSSDLARCLDTANIIASGRKIEIEPRTAFREINMGEWDGRDREEISRLYPDEYAARGRNLTYYRPPGGESFSDLAERVWPAFQEVVKNMNSNILITAHAGVNRAIICKVLGMPVENLFRLKQDYSALNLVDCTGGQFTLCAVNVQPIL